MIEQPITFETAKLAKEKGFREFTDDFYENKNKVIDSILARPNSYDNSNFRFIKCTQSLLQKWLRDVHNIECYIIPVFVGYDYQTYSFFVEKKDYHDEELSELDFKTYEEALEKGLQEALKLIPNI